MPISMHCIDILLTFNTAYYEEGLIIYDRKRIKQNYMQF